MSVLPLGRFSEGRGAKRIRAGDPLAVSSLPLRPVRPSLLFVPLAERTGSIVPKSCSLENAAWRLRYRPALRSVSLPAFGPASPPIIEERHPRPPPLTEKPRASMTKSNPGVVVEGLLEADSFAVHRVLHQTFDGHPRAPSQVHFVGQKTSTIQIRARSSAWIERLPPEQKVISSNLIGRTTSSLSAYTESRLRYRDIPAVQTPRSSALMADREAAVKTGTQAAQSP